MNQEIPSTVSITPLAGPNWRELVLAGVRHRGPGRGMTGNLHGAQKLAVEVDELMTAPTPEGTATRRRRGFVPILLQQSVDGFCEL